MASLSAMMYKTRLSWLSYQLIWPPSHNGPSHNDRWLRGTSHGQLTCLSSGASWLVNPLKISDIFRAKIIPGEMDQYFGYQYPGNISSSYSIDHAGKMNPCLPWGHISTTYTIAMSRYDGNYKWFFYISLKPLSIYRVRHAAWSLSWS